MISRRTTIKIAAAYVLNFKDHTRRYKRTKTRNVQWIDSTRLYTYLYERNYPFDICNEMRTHRLSDGLTQFIMELHTGEFCSLDTMQLSLQERQQYGQQLLLRLAQDYLQTGGKADMFWKIANYNLERNLRNSLQLDGYKIRDGILHKV